MTDRYDDLERQRLNKIEALRARGVNPYPVRFDRTHTAAALHQTYDHLAAGVETGEQASVAGRLMLKRGQGKLAFGQLRDGTASVQLMVALDTAGEDGIAMFEELDLGDWVGASGEIIKTKRGELSVRASSLRLLSKGIRPLPEKWHGLRDVETRYRRRYVDLLVNEDARRVIELRAHATQRIRELMTSRGFMEVETPMLQPQPGGAIARPFVTHMNALDIDLYLRIAPELYLKRLLVAGFERVFEINRNFRNEGVSPQHNPEFTMLEAYQAFADYTEMMELARAIVLAAADDADSFTYQEREVKIGGSWRTSSMLDLVRDAIEEPELSYEWPVEKLREVCDRTGVPWDDSFGTGKLVTELFEKHVEDTLWDPTFVTEFPLEVSPLARVHRTDPNVAERFELFIAGKELGNAFSELNDPLDQRARFEAQARARAAGDEEAMTVDEDYVRALEYGMPPAGGLGIGIDRLVILLANVSTIREVILFPFMRPEAQD